VGFCFLEKKMDIACRVKFRTEAADTTVKDRLKSAIQSVVDDLKTPNSNDEVDVDLAARS
jgi:hypothetical protein